MKKHLKKILRDSIKVFGVVLFTFITGVLTLLSVFFKSIQKILTDYGLLCFICCLSFAIFVSLVYLIIKLLQLINNRSTIGKTREQMYLSLKNDLQYFAKNGKHIDVIRLGTSISRALWLCMEYEHRVKIGDIVYDSACHENDDKTKAKVLIDDIGFTNIVLENYNVGVENIERGIEIAKRINEWFYVSKGYRHLANYSLFYEQQPSVDKIISLLENAKSFIEKIKNNDEIIESNLSIEYAYTEFYYYNKNFDKAEASCMNVREKYNEIQDYDRKCKTYSQLGKIYLGTKTYHEAKEQFLEGIALCNKRNREDELIKCYMGMVICYYQLSNIKQVHDYIGKCEALYNDDFVLFGWDSITKQYKIIAKNVLDKVVIQGENENGDD
jgi:tetratricopeptide (TPR) repeat protein